MEENCGEKHGSVNSVGKIRPKCGSLFEWLAIRSFGRGADPFPYIHGD
jgi:hypothetical protein